jgi:hypothetical protein
MTNAFSKNYVPQIKLKATPKETQLHAALSPEQPLKSGGLAHDNT